MIIILALLMIITAKVTTQTITMKVTKKMYYIDLFNILNLLYMFRTRFSPIIRSKFGIIN
jgi:hypothetical protein